MKVSEIIKAVRWCIDEESNNNSDMADAIDEKDDSYMDNIIKAKINDALRWVCVTAPATLLLGGESKNGINALTKDYTFSSGAEGYNKNWNEDFGIGMITLPSDVSFLRFLRVRGLDWYKAILSPVDEDSEEELTMFNETSKGTYDRPQATVVLGTPMRLLVQPASDSIEVTIAYSPTDSSQDIENDSDIDIPAKVCGAFLYYIAYLLLSAYDDTKATKMYEIALQQLGAQTKQS